MTSLKLDTEVIEQRERRSRVRRRPTLLPARRPTRRRSAIVAGQIGVFVAVLALWQVLATLSPTAEQLLGSPAGVLSTLKDMAAHDGWEQVWTTARTALYGYILGIVAACVATAVLVPFKTVMEFLDPFLLVLNALPRVAIAPIFILWLGVGVEAGIAFVITTIFLLVFMNLYAGARGVDQLYIQNMTALGAPKSALLLQVYVPAVFGWLMASLRTAAAWALLGAALSEYLAGSSGLGYLLAQGGMLADPDLVSAAATLIAVMALLAHLLLGIIDRRLTRWRTS